MFDKIATPFPIPTRSRHQLGDAEMPESDTTEPVPDSGKITNVQTFCGSAHNELPICSEYGEPDEHKNEEIFYDTRLTSDEIREIEEFYDAHLRPSDLVLRYDGSCSTVSKASSVDSESDSPIPSFGPSDSDDSICDYNDFMRAFRILLKTESKMVFELDNFVENSEWYPTKLDFSDWNIPELVTTFTLKYLKIVAPKSLWSSSRLPGELAPALDINGNNVSRKEESIIRDRGRFLLQKIQSFSLLHFVFMNDSDGSLLGKMSRIGLWHNALEKFLNRHSSTLEKICIRTVMNHSVAKYTPDDIFKGPHKFQQLQELDLIFWAPPWHIEKTDEEKSAWTRNYWVKFLRSRDHLGQLRRLVWMCPKEISFTEIWVPIFHHNKESLRTLHIVTSECHLEPERGESNRDQIYTCISCSVFVKLINLESLYLRKSLCFLQRLDLLPPSLTELLLDGLCIETCDIITAVEKLTNLKRLRLVNNMVPFISPKRHTFGVDLEVIKTILCHRKLDDLFIWGYTMTQKRKIIPLTPPPSDVHERLSKIQRLKSLCSSLKSSLMKSNPVTKLEKLMPTKDINDILQKIAIIDENSICIKGYSTALPTSPSTTYTGD